MRLSARSQQGFSLVELMVGLVAGMIVVGAVSSFTVATLRASNQNIQSSRLTQDLRTTMGLVTRELRRSGYDGDAISRLGTGVSLSSFTALEAPPFGVAGCVSYQYTRDGGAAPFRAIRLNNGALEMGTSNTTIVNCNAGNWSAISDSDVVTITSFAPVETREPFASIVQSRVVGTDTEVMAGCGVVRNVAIDITGSLVADASVSRTVREEVRVRADPLRFTTQTFPGLAGPTPADECTVMNACLAAYGQTAPGCP